MKSTLTGCEIIIHNKRNTIVETIKKSRLNQYVSISGEEAGAHFLMKIETKKPQEQLMENAKRRELNCLHCLRTIRKIGKKSKTLMS